MRLLGSLIVVAVVSMQLFAGEAVADSTQGRRNLGRGVAREGDPLLLGDPGAEVTVDLAGAEPLPDPPHGLVVLRTARGRGSRLQLLDRRGGQVGIIDVPDGWTGFATETTVV